MLAIQATLNSKTIANYRINTWAKDEFYLGFGGLGDFDVKNEPAGSFFIKIYYKCSKFFASPASSTGLLDCAICENFQRVTCNRFVLTRGPLHHQYRR
jgi:hypothetical protein